MFKALIFVVHMQPKATLPCDMVEKLMFDIRVDYL